MKRRLSAILKILVGLALGLVLAELWFRARDEGAFAHVNFYEADAALGVRLRPHAQMRIAFSGNPVTELRTNDRGFRGADWSAASPRDVLVVGDSQVFGLGVNESDTFSAKLEAALGHGVHVINAGVPTYGPIEYTTLVERLTAERKPDAVVYVLNMSNDLFELGRSNAERHVVWDGWAVRKETAPTSAIEFPFRAWLMSQSHLMYAMRRVWHGDLARDPAFASEGTWQELSTTAQTHTPAKIASEDDLRGLRTKRDELAGSLQNLDYLLFRSLSAGVERGNARYGKAIKDLTGFAGDPRDILLNTNAEEARPVNETAFQLVAAAVAVTKNDEALYALAGATKDAGMLDLLKKRRALREEFTQATGEAFPESANQDAIDAMLARTKRACDAVNARLLVVVLPVDVQVSKDEWRKYGSASAAIDMSSTLVLNQDVARRAQRQGALAFDALPALSAVEPGAFLAGDLHMTAKGHAALANAIAKTLTQAQPIRNALPVGRSPMPYEEEWAEATPTSNPSVDAADCVVKNVREWWRIRCKESGSGLELLSGGLGEAYAYASQKNFAALSNDMTLMLPIENHGSLDAWFHWMGGRRRLRAEWPQDSSKPTLSFGQLEKFAALDHIVPTGIDGEHRSDHCRVWNDANICKPGELAFGVMQCCVPRCSIDDPCKSGRCMLWNGERGCVTP